MACPPPGTRDALLVSRGEGAPPPGPPPPRSAARWMDTSCIDRGSVGARLSRKPGTSEAISYDARCYCAFLDGCGVNKPVVPSSHVNTLFQKRPPHSTCSSWSRRLVAIERCTFSGVCGIQLDPSNCGAEGACALRHHPNWVFAYHVTRGKRFAAAPARPLFVEVHRAR